MKKLEEVLQDWEAVIGLEIHCELTKLETKMFCGCKLEFGAEPNTHTCPVCLGLPGALPVPNKAAIESIVLAGLATNCDIEKHSMFYRKNYMYPDMAKNFQTTQGPVAFCMRGHLDLEVDGAGAKERIDIDDLQVGETRGNITKTEDGYIAHVGIERIHMEEDAGKLVHDDWEDVSYVDYNRSGVPLIEIVSEPDMRSAEEVIAYLEKLRLIIQYLGASDCKLQEGSMRADVNLSVREVGSTEFGTRTETKNLNSFSAISRAIEAERDRQIDLIESGEAVIQETRRWDDNKAYSYAMRSKEDAQDYRYFPDPDLVPLNISDEWLGEIRIRQPEFKTEKMARYATEYGIPEYDINLITDSKKLADIFEATTSLCNQPKKVSNWILGETMRILKDKDMEPEDITFSPENLAKLIKLVEAGTINGSVAKDIFAVIFDEDVDPEAYVKEKGLAQVSDEGELRSVVEKVIADNAQSVEDYRNGKDKAIGFLVGQTMKAMKGKANPGLVNKILKELL